MARRGVPLDPWVERWAVAKARSKSLRDPNPTRRSASSATGTPGSLVSSSSAATRRWSVSGAAHGTGVHIASGPDRNTSAWHWDNPLHHESSTIMVATERQTLWGPRAPLFLSRPGDERSHHQRGALLLSSVWQAWWVLGAKPADARSTLIEVLA